MKYIASTFFLLLFFLSHGHAQKFAYVDVDYILEHIPEFGSAQTQLDETTEKWQEAIKKMELEVIELKNNYVNEEVLYTEEMKKKKWKSIQNKEVEIYEFKQLKFGYEGELFVKRQELIKPIQDNIYAAIEELAKSKRYDFIFDKSSTPIMLYAKDDYDKSDMIIKALGYNP